MLSPDLDGCEIFERSFDFSKLPNLQELAIGVGWIGGDLLWIPTALSTLTPATSPRLTIIQLNFTRPSIINRSVGVAVRHIGNNLRRIADEVFRIEQEFGGVVNVTVLRDPGFGTVLDTLNVRFRFYRPYLMVMLIHSCLLFVDLSGLRSLERADSHFAGLDYLVMYATEWLI